MSYTRGVKPESRMATQSHGLATHSQTQSHMSHHLQQQQQQQATHRLVIKKQTSLAEEKLGQEGEQKLVHIVVKNTPFLIHLELQPLSSSTTPSLSTSGNFLQQQHTHLMDQDQHMHYLSLQSSLNFSNIHIDASLVYDSPDLKAVDFVRAKPLDFKAQPLDKPDSLTLETRIKVLTSQHEDMMFRIRISGLDVSTKKEIPGLDVITVPIKVVSKPDQAHRSKERSVSAANSSHNSASNSDSEAPPSSFPPCGAPSLSGHVTAKKKRSFQEFVQESLSRIEREQYEHRSIFARLVEGSVAPDRSIPIGGIVNPNGNGYGCFESCVGSTGSTPSASPISSPFVTPYGSPSTDSLESSFSQFLHCLNRVDPAERPNKIRKLLASVHPTESETLHQVVETIRSDMPMTGFPNEYEFEYDSYGSAISSRNATCNNSEISVEDAQYSMVDQYSYSAGFPAE
eukprot:TRINITY_DN741_c3_g1_i2.p1 TRINITY_DN741_c3_g1~~TRINITY_DN741_c3_g1_i2.p1  ORF type:complete len:456 (-),score=210.04 TRINITY_DN741_c3_g1_i2:490-1857(-)